MTDSVIDHRAQFAAAINAAGLTAPDEIHDDGEIHRFPTNGKASDTSGWYVLYGDGIPSGEFGCWRAGIQQPFRADIGRRLTKPEREAQTQRLAEAKAKREQARAEARAAAKAAADKLWNAASKTPNPDHPYLIRKLAKPHGIRQDGDTLYVPVYDATKLLIGLQRIYANGGKYFLDGMQAAGGYTVIGSDASKITLCEGWATGSTLFDATGRTSVIAFNAGNLPAIARLMRERYPDADIVVAADNDQYARIKSDNPGVKAGKQAAREASARLAIPAFSAPDLAGKPTDFNDMFVLYGADSVRRAIEESELVAGDAPFNHETTDTAVEAGSQHEPETPAAAAQETVAEPVLDHQANNGTSSGAEFPPLSPPDAAAYEPASEPVLPGTGAEGVTDTDAPADVSRETPATDARRAVAAPSIQPEIGLWRSLGLVLNGNGQPLQNLDNVVRVLAGDPNLTKSIWYDEFLDSVLTTWPDTEPRQWKDADDVLLTLYMQRHVGLHKIGIETCHAAALVAAFHNTQNECKAWISGHSWDGVPRLAHLMSEGFGAEPDSYTEAVGRCWVISMVARVMQPGCKVDTVPVLEGDQGSFKSTGLSILGGKWFVECHESVTSKDFYGVLQGHMLVEISEMHSFTRAEVERIKGIISCQIDRFRKAYGRNTEDHPRQTVLTCTTNRDDWQRDDTGARRFWPIRCGVVNLEWLRNNRDQLFAEAFQLYQIGTPWWDVSVDRQREEADARRDADEWETIIEGWLIGREYSSRPSTSEVLADCLKIEIAKQDQMLQRRVNRIMRILGWRQVVTRTGKGGRSFRVWDKIRLLPRKSEMP